MLFWGMVKVLTNHPDGDMVVQISKQLIQQLLRYFTQNHKFKPYGGVRSKVVSGSPLSLGFFLCGPAISVQNCRKQVAVPTI